MIHFNRLNISSNGNCLYIEVEVDLDRFFDNVFIDSIIIDNLDSYVNNGPSNKPVYEFHAKLNLKIVKLTLASKDLNANLNSDMLFVYAIASGTPASDTPCGKDTNIIMNTVINLLPIYRNIMYYIREVNKDCSIPKGFIDKILLFKAIEVGVKTGNYLEAIKIWKKFFNGKNNKNVISSCKCNG